MTGQSSILEMMADPMYWGSLGWLTVAVAITLGSIACGTVLVALVARLVPALAWPMRIIGILLVACSGVPLLVGGLGVVQGRSHVYAAVAHVDPAQKGTILAMGLHEANVPGALGGFGSLCVFFPALLVPLVTVGAGRGAFEDVPE